MRGCGSYATFIILVRKASANTIVYYAGRVIFVKRSRLSHPQKPDEVVGLIKFASAIIRRKKTMRIYRCNVYTLYEEYKLSDMFPLLVTRLCEPRTPICTAKLSKVPLSDELRTLKSLRCEEHKGKREKALFSRCTLGT